MPLLEVKDLSVRIGNHLAVERVSFAVEAGEVVAIVGPNGSGKTTLIKAILGLINYSGSVHLAGRTVVGYVPQRFSFDRNFPITVKEFLLLQMEEASIFFPNSKALRRIKNALEEVHGEDFLDSLLGELSGGQLQRVLIAAALQNEPNIVFLDEALSGIDAGGEETVYSLIRELSISKNLAIVMISHDLDVVYQHCRRVICLNRKMICAGRPQEALSKETLDKLYGAHTSIYEHEANNHAHKTKHHHHHFIFSRTRLYLF